MLYFWVVTISLLFVVMALATCMKKKEVKPVQVKAFRKGRK